MQSLERRKRRKSKDNHKQLIYCTPETGGQPRLLPHQNDGSTNKTALLGPEMGPQVQGAETAPQTQHTF